MGRYKAWSNIMVREELGISLSDPRERNQTRVPLTLDEAVHPPNMERLGWRSRNTEADTKGRADL